MLQVVGGETARLASTVRRLSLSELLVTSEGEKRKPLLLLFDENQLACELNLFHLHKELQKVVGVRDLYFLLITLEMYTYSVFLLLSTLFIS